MKQLTKQQQKDEAFEAYAAIKDPAFEAYKAITDQALKAYEAKLAEINAQLKENK